MKKSDMLKRLLAVAIIENGVGRFPYYICNKLKTAFWADSLELITWMEDNMKATLPINYAHTIGLASYEVSLDNRGVIYWLYIKGYVTIQQVDIGRFDVAAQEYRYLWLQDMIAYWESQGD